MTITLACMDPADRERLDEAMDAWRKNWLFRYSGLLGPTRRLEQARALLAEVEFGDTGANYGARCACPWCGGDAPDIGDAGGHRPSCEWLAWMEGTP